MRRTPDETAVLLALLLVRSEQKRARVSEKTIRRLAKRKRLRAAFITMLRHYLEDRALVMIELDDGSWGLMPSKGLQGAPAITAGRYMVDDLKELKNDPDRAWRRFRDLLEADDGVEEDEE